MFHLPKESTDEHANLLAFEQETIMAFGRFYHMVLSIGKVPGQLKLLTHRIENITRDGSDKDGYLYVVQPLRSPQVGCAPSHVSP